MYKGRSSVLSGRCRAFVHEDAIQRSQDGAIQGQLAHAHSGQERRCSQQPTEHKSVQKVSMPAHKEPYFGADMSLHSDSLGIRAFLHQTLSIVHLQMQSEQVNPRKAISRSHVL